jgi:hypothetical protein
MSKRGQHEVRSDLAEDHGARLDRHDRKLLQRAPLTFLDQPDAGHHRTDEGEDEPDDGRHHHPCGGEVGVEEHLDLDLVPEPVER